MLRSLYSQDFLRFLKKKKKDLYDWTLGRLSPRELLFNNRAGDEAQSGTYISLGAIVKIELKCHSKNGSIYLFIYTYL